MVYASWPDVRPGLDFILVAKPLAARAKFAMLKQEFLDLARKGGLLQ